MSESVALLGSTGFVGASVKEALESRGIEVVCIPAPRLKTSQRSPELLMREGAQHEAVATLAEALRGSDVVVNAAGDPDASSLDTDRLYGANALLPALLLQAAKDAGVSRLVHVSSAVVQNDIQRLDQSEDMRPFSAYSASKVAGERVLRHATTWPEVVRYRPPSVHGPGRRVSRLIGRIASSPLASVASPGDQGTPQALLPNVGDAVAFLATVPETPPAVVIHPSEGVSVSSLMRDLGGKDPLKLPRWLAIVGIRLAKLAGRWHPPTAANARRLELLWVGQEQATSWLSTAGWTPVVGRAGWAALGRDVRKGGAA